MEVLEFSYGWSKVKARLTKGGGVYVDLPAKCGRGGSTIRESIVLEDRGWRFTSTQDECIEYYFHVWLTENGTVSWTNDLSSRIQYLDEPFNPDYPNAGLINDTVIKLHTIAKTIKDYQKRNLPIEEVFELRKYYLDTTLKMLGYDSIDSVGEKLKEPGRYLGLSRVAENLESYKQLAHLVYSLGKAGDYDMYTQRLNSEVTREEVIEYIRSVKEQVDANVAFMQEQETGIETKRLVYPEYRRNLCKKTGIYTWEDYEEKVKSVALLLLELNADLLTPAQREKLGIPEFEFIDQIGAEDKISTIIDNKDFNDACRVEDELAYQEARELVRRAKEIKPEVYPSDPEAITTEDIVGIMESELKVITERKDAIENHEKIYAKYYSKARKQREKVKLHSDEYRY